MTMILRSSANRLRDTGLTKLDIVPCGGVPKGISPKEPIFIVNKQRILICLEFSTTRLNKITEAFCLWLLQGYVMNESNLKISATEEYFDE